MNLTEQSSQTYEARFKYGGFMRLKIEVEVVLPDGNMATLVGGTLRGTGTISVGDAIYQVSSSYMKDGATKLVRFIVGGIYRDMHSTRLYDLELNRCFTLHQARHWSAHLLLKEDDRDVGDFQPNLLGSRYQIHVNRNVPRKIVLLCVWVTMIRGEFSG